MAVAAPVNRTKSRGMAKQEKRNIRLGLLFISPWLIGFIALSLIPLAMSLYYSLTRYDLIRPPQFIGVTNYVRLFNDDPDFGSSFATHFTMYCSACRLGHLLRF